VAVGGTYVKDELDTESYELQGLDAQVRLGQNTRVVAEYAQSKGTDAVVFVSRDGGITYSEFAANGVREGDAWKLGVELDVGEWFGNPDRYQLGGFYKRLEPGFRSNGNYLEAGTDKSGVNLSLRLTDKDSLRGKYEMISTEATTTTPESEEDIGTFQYLHDHGWWGITLEVQTRDQQTAAATDRERDSYGAAKFSLNPTEDLTLNLEHQQTISGVENNQTTAGVRYQLLPNLALEASGTVGTNGSSALAGAVLKVGEKEFYVNQRMADHTAGKTTTTVVGTQAPIGKDARIYSEYQWQKAQGGDKNMSVLGAQRQWDALQGLKLLLSGEYATTDAATTDTSQLSIAAGLSYAHPAGFKFTTREEIRKDQAAEDTVQFLTANNLDLKLNPDFTLLGKFRYSKTVNETTDQDDAFFTEFSIGLAYRPVHFDRFNALAKITVLDQMGPLELGETEAFTSASDVASIEWSLDLTRSLEWVQKAAYKVKTEQAGLLPETSSETLLSINRLNWNFWRKFDLGVEYRILAQQLADDKRQGWLTELMWEPVDHYRVGVGYNFTDFSDNEFSDNDYSLHGWFLRLQATF
jgi:hypothetical protein